MTDLRLSSLCGLVLALATGCGDPADFAGKYNVGIINGQNGCELPTWTVGSTANVGLTITQTPSLISGQLDGLTRVFLNLALGADTFSGTATGTRLDLRLTGMRAQSRGACAYTINATALATLNGESLSGTIDYTTVTNNVPDCGALQGCRSQQSFSGLRTAR